MTHCRPSLSSDDISWDSVLRLNYKNSQGLLTQTYAIYYPESRHLTSYIIFQNKLKGYNNNAQTTCLERISIDN